MDFTNLTNPIALLGLATLLAAGAALYLAALTIFALVSLRRPRRRTYAYAVARNVPGEPAELDTPAEHTTTAVVCDLVGRERIINTWTVTGDNPHGPTVIATHGWGSCRIDMLSRFKALRPHAARVVLWDMPGHGDTPGVCTLAAREPADLASIIASVAHPIDDEASTSMPPRIVLYGYSLGAEVTLKAMTRLTLADVNRTDIAGVILEAPYRRGITPAKAVMDASEFPRLLNLPLAMSIGSVLNGTPPNERWHDLAERYASQLSNVDNADPIPLLVIHGEHDTISPLEDGRAIADAGDGAIVVITDAGHKDLYSSKTPTRPEIVTALSAFFKDLGTDLSNTFD